MALVLFELFVAALLCFEYIKNRQLLNPLSLFAVPYMVIIGINNVFAVNNGFYKIEDSVIYMILLAVFMFFLGTNFIGLKIPESVQSKSNTLDKINRYNINKMKKYALFVLLVAYLKLLIAVYKNGISWLGSNKNEGYVMTGLSGHLLLTLYVIVPILFTYWLMNKKDKGALLLCLLTFFVIFLSFIKYHIICLVVLVFLFVVGENKDYLIKGIIIVLGSSIGIFVLNYVVAFVLNNIIGDVSNTFYLNHLWKYLGGSVINDNIIFNSGIDIGVSLMYKLGSILFTLPNMFLVKLGYNEICPKTGLDGMHLVSSQGEASNVTDFIGYIFPSRGDIFDMVSFCMFMYLFGLICQYIFFKYKKSNHVFEVDVWVFFTFFCFFSFFGVYGTLSSPWEILVYSMIIPAFFSGKIRMGK